MIYSPTFTIKINHSCRCIYQSHGSVMGMPMTCDLWPPPETVRWSSIFLPADGGVGGATAATEPGICTGSFFSSQFLKKYGPEGFEHLQLRVFATPHWLGLICFGWWFFFKRILLIYYGFHHDKTSLNQPPFFRSFSKHFRQIQVERCFYCFLYMFSSVGCSSKARLVESGSGTKLGVDPKEPWQQEVL